MAELKDEAQTPNKSIALSTHLSNTSQAKSYGRGNKNTKYQKRGFYSSE